MKKYERPHKDPSEYPDPEPGSFAWCLAGPAAGNGKDPIDHAGFETAEERKARRKAKDGKGNGAKSKAAMTPADKLAERERGR